MLYIAIALFWAWFLQLFGFDGVVAKGMQEVFDITISTTGYYFLFSLLGALRIALYSLNPNFGMKIDLTKDKKK